MAVIHTIQWSLFLAILLFLDSILDHSNHKAKFVLPAIPRQIHGIKKDNAHILTLYQLSKVTNNIIKQILSEPEKTTPTIPTHS